MILNENDILNISPEIFLLNRICKVENEGSLKGKALLLYGEWFVTTSTRFTYLTPKNKFEGFDMNTEANYPLFTDSELPYESNSRLVLCFLWAEKGYYGQQFAVMKANVSLINRDGNTLAIFHK